MRVGGDGTEGRWKGSVRVGGEEEAEGYGRETDEREVRARR